MRRESFELEGGKNGGEEREREPIGFGEGGEMGSFNFCKSTPHTSNILK